MPRYTGGAAIASEQQWGFRTRQVENDVTVNTTPTQILAFNPERIGVFIVNQSANAGRVSKKPSVTTSLGVPVDANGGSMSLTPRSDGEGTADELWAILAVAQGTFTVVEVIRTEGQ